MLNARTALRFFLLTLALAPAAHAQQPEGLGEDVAASATREPSAQPNDRPLTGIREQGLGSTRRRHSFIQPSATVSWIWDSNGSFQYGSRNATSLLGEVSVVRYMGRGGSLEYNGSVQYDSSKAEYQDQLLTSQLLRWTQEFSGRVWSLLLSEQSLFTPSSIGGTLGYSSMGMASPEDLGISVLDPSVVPDQTVLTESSPRLTNTAAVEAEYRLSGRSNLTLSGANGIFRSINDKLLDGTQYNGIAGYNRAFTRHDTGALSIGYELDRIDQMGVTVRSYSPGLKLEHRTAGRFLAHMSGYAQPYEITAARLSRDMFSWGGTAGVQYKFGRNVLQADVNRSLSLGSGVLSGARTIWGSFTVTRPLTRRWQSNFNGVYSRSSGLINGVVYPTQYGAAALQRQLTRSSGMFFYYGLQHGLSNCTATGCGAAMLQQVVSLGINWTRLPVGRMF